MTINLVHFIDLAPSLIHALTIMFWKETARAGLSIVPVLPWEGAPPPGAPDQLPKFLTRCFDV